MIAPAVFRISFVELCRNESARRSAGIGDQMGFATLNFGL
jgi:hypothetical protein